jgi:hypothetical protein
MMLPPAHDGFEISEEFDRLRRVIPVYARAGLLRRVGLPDGGVEFVETQTDHVFASFDGKGRPLAGPAATMVAGLVFDPAA